MIDRRGQNVALICDVCESEEFGPYHRDDFELMVIESREAGWKGTRTAGQWRHQCPDCKPSALERAMDLFGV